MLRKLEAEMGSPPKPIFFENLAPGQKNLQANEYYIQGQRNPRQVYPGYPGYPFQIPPPPYDRFNRTNYYSRAFPIPPSPPYYPPPRPTYATTSTTTTSTTTTPAPTIWTTVYPNFGPIRVSVSNPKAIVLIGKKSIEPSNGTMYESRPIGPSSDWSPGTAKTTAGPMLLNFTGKPTASSYYSQSHQAEYYDDLCWETLIGQVLNFDDMQIYQIKDYRK
jgi:hypothetical protein